MTSRCDVRSRSHDFAGAYALVTGGSRGLGYALAFELLRQGAQVALVARDERRLLGAKEELDRKFGRRVDIAACDLGEPTALATNVSQLIERWGRIDLLVNNAGIIQHGPAEFVSIADWERALHVHFWSPLYAMREVIPRMRAQGEGRIVNISSVEGKVPFPRIAPSCASKFALTAMSESFGYELASDRIWVTTVYPGLMHAQASGLFDGLSLPRRLVSMRYGRAARLILRASARRKRSLDLGLTTKLLALGRGLLPASMGALMTRADAHLREDTAAQEG
jgi:short-subunit dehydrogenase